MDAFDYLCATTDRPFIIFCDVNLPSMTGLEFKKKVDDNKELRRRSIPFIFYSTSVNQNAVNEAYTKMTVQGFFPKSNSFEEMRKMLALIIDYWMYCRHPNC
jgi:CheY-like chemotaxis protein